MGWKDWENGGVQMDAHKFDCGPGYRLCYLDDKTKEIFRRYFQR